MTSKDTSKSFSRPELAREIKVLEMQRQTEALDQLKRITMERELEIDHYSVQSARRHEGMVVMCATRQQTLIAASVFNDVCLFASR
jgi:hypothetical protein